MASTAAPHSLGSGPGPWSGEGRLLLVAFAVSLLLHVAGVIVTRVVRVDLSRAAPVPRERSVEIALEPEPSATAATSAPDQAAAEAERERIFTSIPERLASDRPPEDDPSQPQYLAMYHSLAANPTLGGDALQPTAPRPGEAPMVSLRREQLEGATGVQVAESGGAVPERERERTPFEQARDEAERQRQERARLEQERKRGHAFATDDRGDIPLPRPDDEAEARAAAEAEARAPALAKWWQGSAPSVLRPGAQGVPGDRGYEFDQDATGPQTSGVARVGDYSLNTWEWNYAPWMQAFGNALMRNWVPPPARRMGLISGKTVLRVIVDKSGVVSAAEIVETDGHQSLHDASRAALLSSSPFAPLPAHFPLAHLEIRLTMFYPEPTR